MFNSAYTERCTCLLRVVGIAFIEINFQYIDQRRVVWKIPPFAHYTNEL